MSERSVKVQKLNSNNTNSVSESSETVRRRIPKACNYCRQRKIKCNGDSPCLNCVNHKIDCVYSKAVRKRKRQHHVKKTSLQDLDKRVTKLDQKFEILSGQLSKILMMLENKDGKLPNHNMHRHQRVHHSCEEESEDSEEESEESEEADEFDDNDEEYEEEIIEPRSNSTSTPSTQQRSDTINGNFNPFSNRALNEKQSPYPASPVESINSSVKLSSNSSSMSLPVQKVPVNQFMPDQQFSFGNISNQANGFGNLPDFGMSWNTIENPEQKLNYIYGHEMPLIQTQLENEMF